MDWRLIQYLSEARTIAPRFRLKQFKLKGTAQQYSMMGLEPTYKRTRVFKAIRVLEAGRGWHAKRYYVLPEEERVIVELKDGGWQDEECVEVTIVSGGDQKAHRWAKRPYVSKKTGKPNPNVHVGTQWEDYLPNLGDQYGFTGGRAIVYKEDLE